MTQPGVGESWYHSHNLEQLAGLKDTNNLGRDIDLSIDLNEYRRLHPDYNVYALTGAVLSRLGMPTLKETSWQKKIFIEPVHPYIFNPLFNNKPFFGEIDLYLWSGEQLKIAGNFYGAVKKVGGTPNGVMFIDDIHLADELKNKTIQLKRGVFGATIETEVINGRTDRSTLLVAPSEVLYPEVCFESNLRDAGFELIEKLKVTEGVILRGDKRERIKGDKSKGEQDIYLWERGVDGEDSKADPNCDILDLAYRLDLIQRNDGGIVLISEEYKEQQARVIRLQRIMSATYPKLLNVITAFTPVRVG